MSTKVENTTSSQHDAKLPVSGVLELLEQKLKEVIEEPVPSDDSTGLEEKEIQIGYIKGVMEFISDLSANDR